MTAHAAPQTGSRTRERLAVTGRPTGADLTDGGFVLALGLLALWGFRTTFDSPRFLLAGGIGLLLGIAIAHIATVLKQHWLVIALLVVVAFFLFGGAVALTSESLAGVVPTGAVLGKLALLTVTGWKDLLTTLPPVDGGGQFLVLPYLLGLVTGSVAFAWARRAGSPAWPALMPVLLLAVVILLGTAEPAGLLLQGLGVGALTFLWVVLRRRRRLRIVGTGGGMRSQVMIGAGLIAISLALATLLGGHLPGTDSERIVLRTYVQPPFDITQYPSPLVGFRKYTEGAKKVWDQELFTIVGAPDGSLVRIAILDDYSGTVWSAGSASGGTGSQFRKVGSTIAATGPATTGESTTATVTVRAAYAGLSDANAWLPSVGYVTRLTFTGDRTKELAESLRYNPSTGQAVVGARLREGDSFRVTAAGVASVPKDFKGFTGGSAVAVPSEMTQPVSSRAVKWAQKKPTAAEQLQAVAAVLHGGAYSDGTKSGETQYLPGHGVSRTNTFLGRPQLVGNDEQYASTFALMANSLGVPARVVMGAVVPTGGAVRGRDVHAWVELQAADGKWYAVPTATFMPDRNKAPEKQPRAMAPDASAADVPPPNSQRPPGTVDATFDTTNGQVKPPTLLDRLFALPGWVLVILQIIGYPVIALAAAAGILAVIRALRRRRRKSTGPPSRRLAQGWRDYVDHARDLGIRVPVALTRREQVALVGQEELAQRADAAVFGAGEPPPEAIAEYWAQIKAARAALTAASSRKRRLLRRFALRGLLVRDPRPVEQLPSSAPQRVRGIRMPSLRKARA